MTEPFTPVGAPSEPARYTAPTAPSTSERTAPSAPVWSLSQRVGFRFVFSYLVLYVASTIGGFLRPLSRPLDRMWRAVVPWVGAHVLHLAKPITVFPAGSGDTTFNYVQLLCFVALAVAATAVWSVADRRRPNYVRLHHYLRIGVRYTLAFWMMAYGGAKLIKTQFPFPYLDRLLEPYGQSSPMGLLWTMMGYSMPYNVFAGLAEAVSGVLLLWRRTTTLGALFVMAVMSNVVMLNFAYDVPVKLFSTHLFLMGLFLAAPGCGRVCDALVLGRAVPAEPAVPHTSRRWLRVTQLVLKPLLVIAIVGMPLWSSWRASRQYGDRRVKPPLYGIWEVTDFARNHQLVAPLLTDSTRWRYLVVDFPGRMSVHVMNDAIHRYNAKVDTVARHVLFTVPHDSTNMMTFEYATPDTSRLELTGVAGTDSLHVTLRRIGPHGYLLVDRGFHWINEYPYNR